MATRNKLVRDLIPSLIQEQGKSVTTRILENDEFKKELEKKLQEEVTEFLNDDNSEELADILEVLYALAELKGVSKTKLEEIRKNKTLKNGAFNNKVFLIEVN